MKYKSFAFIRFEKREEAKQRLQARWIMNRRLPVELRFANGRRYEQSNEKKGSRGGIRWEI